MQERDDTRVVKVICLLFYFNCKVYRSLQGYSFRILSFGAYFNVFIICLSSESFTLSDSDVLFGPFGNTWNNCILPGYFFSNVWWNVFTLRFISSTHEAVENSLILRTTHSSTFFTISFLVPYFIFELWATCNCLPKRTSSMKAIFLHMSTGISDLFKCLFVYHIGVKSIIS